VYFGKDGDLMVILLGGSAKRDQQRAIERAKAAWAEYKARKRAANK
jgi:putative component of toxin-antitoxin plasmid stabilization module